MNPPEILYLGAADYVVKQKKKLDLLGETLNNDTTILIKKSQSAACKRDTVLHEVLHAIIWLSGLGHELETDAEEKLVRLFTPWILAVIRDNPELIAYLVEA